MKPQNKNTKNGSATAANDNQSGTVGFNPQLAGHAKAEHSNTSSFDVAPLEDSLPENPSADETIVGQEEGGRYRQPTSSIVGRVREEKEIKPNNQ